MLSCVIYYLKKLIYTLL